jgi:hypothetical protein
MRDKLKFWLGVVDRLLDSRIIYRFSPEEKVAIWNNIFFSDDHLVKLSD